MPKISKNSLEKDSICTVHSFCVIMHFEKVLCEHIANMPMSKSCDKVVTEKSLKKVFSDVRTFFLSFVYKQKVVIANSEC